MSELQYVVSTYVLRGLGGGPQIYFLENCFIVFLDIIGHGAFKTFYGIKNIISFRRYRDFKIAIITG